MAKGFELSLMVGASVAGALDGLAKVYKSMSQVWESSKKLSEVSKKLSTFDEARGELNNLKTKQILEFNKTKIAIEKESYNLKDYREKLSKVNKKIEIQNKLKTIQNKYNSRVEKLSKLEIFREKAITRGAVAGARIELDKTWGKFEGLYSIEKLPIILIVEIILVI